jgi:hypothetical protein
MASTRKDTIIQLLIIFGFFLYFITAISVCINPSMPPFFTKINYSLLALTPIYGVGLSNFLVFRARGKYSSQRVYITALIFIFTTIALTLVSVIAFFLFSKLLS